ncbi:LLM class flavin-dependent oxidoreductase [Gulosibacter faecalis]|jgi:alkanesulfonate monooxygenase SsuD/methylene tetrahydromethanopterin reductase-like flavin-dependent oxidoreductase (luciferase family)|uniref:LLM class flavin-dependent oxidoreductase n=1 Tax=Gulosibacter faecalis TaxID=272240 RepID=A0ABW5UX70_9MICO|nr:LLM class flavin-dependent oxidoreductase [Gulosibacter faecalis]
MTTAPFTLALELDGAGAHPTAWRFAAHSPAEALTPRRLADKVRSAERAGFHYVTLSDNTAAPEAAGPSAARLDSVLLAAFAGPLTSTIGLVPVASAVWAEPFHLSGQISSLDHASAGRAGWLIDGTTSPAASATLGREELTGDELLAETNDVVTAATQLWDSWEDDAVIIDIDSGRFLDNQRLHAINFASERFTVRGPSITPRPLQGRPPVFGRIGEVDPSLIDVALVRGDSVEAIAEAAARARELGVGRVIAEVEVVLDARGETAASRLAALDAAALADGVPAHRPDSLRVVGDSAELVELIAQLQRAVDGVRILPAVLDVDGDELERLVLPELRRLEIAAAPTFGATLRETLGLERPANVFATAATTHA